METFFHMGGYAAYVWPAYIVSALGLGGLAFHTWRRGWMLARRLKAIEAARRSDSAAADAPPSPPA